MLSENTVIDAVSNHLATKGYRVIQEPKTSQRGIDIIDVRGRAAIAVPEEDLHRHRAVGWATDEVENWTQATTAGTDASCDQR